jgi:GT2 family glycosyltransferase
MKSAKSAASVSAGFDLNAQATTIEDRCVDLMYLACNRLEFTQETFKTLIANTDWRYVHELFVYDDGSVDGTREWLEKSIGEVSSRTRFVMTNLGSPVAAMAHFIESAGAPVLAKTDNDVMLPPAWLRQSLEVLDRHPDLSFLGIEAMYPHCDDTQIVRGYAPAQFISGLGLYRRSAFSRGRPRANQKWFGFEEWQIAQGSGLVRGWITPAIPVFLLDRIPFEPWERHTTDYVKRGWQRPWPRYKTTSGLWNWRWPDQTLVNHVTGTNPIARPIEFSTTEDNLSTSRDGRNTNDGILSFKVVVLSARASNLVPCVRSVLMNEPALPPDHILVVDDGARSQAEAQLPSIRWLSGNKPFNFSRNANLGIREAGTDVILLNDDARLLTFRGFTLLSQKVKEQRQIGVCSAGIQGVVGNPGQINSRCAQLRLETRVLAFVCVYIPKAVYEQLGLLDERFSGYGFEDNDYCARVLAAGLQLGIWDGCLIDHSGELPSTFRNRPDLWTLFQQNRRQFREKWGKDA